MNRIKLLLDVIEDVRSLSDSLQSLADAMASDEPIEQPKTTSESKPKVQKPDKAAPVTLEDVRKVLAEKSRAGFTDEVRVIITKHGAEKLSDIDPSEYESVLSDAEVLGNG